MEDSPMLIAIIVCGVDGFHAHVESQNKIVEIQPDSPTVCNGYLFVEFVDVEFPARLVSIVTNGPYITCINKCRAVEFPEQFCSIFQVQFKFHVTRLVDEIDSPMTTLESSWS